MKALSIAAFLLAALVASTGPAVAAGPGLDEARRAVLLDIPAIHGSAPDASALERPVVIVATWASWCFSCHLEMARLKQAHARYGPENVTILAINLFEEYGRSPEGRERDLFVKRHDPPFAVLQGDSDFVAAFAPVGVPNLFVFGPGGRAVALGPDAPGTELTALDGSGLEAAIDRILADRAS
ncbi:MAG: TlpA family protein disulfide reductase [Rhodospirillaceae bacterium]|jgi:thiol-disulfide isomerase/thioredoxin|nr:TlpA family protein disulfide reductase [Rhodospirillaceae bacterium]MBT6117804.1 TlpA family protein disulfide reductase [Rhodospirillaceae bacterium]